METIDIISFSITVGLGVISLILSVFAIWLSKSFSKDSSDALSSLRDLLKEIGALTDLNLQNQRDFSNKMLDSIIEKSNYGENKSKEYGQEQLQDIFEAKFKSFETRFSEEITEKVKTLSNRPDDKNEMRKIISEIQNDIQRFTKTASKVASETMLPFEIKNKLKKYLEFPAHFLMIYAITKEDIKSVKELENCVKKYSIPNGWKSGLRNLIEDDILIGTLSNFSINEEYKGHINNWISLNSNIFQKFLEYFSDDKTKDGVAPEEIVMANELEF